LHMAQLIPLLLTVSCFSKIQIGFTFLVPAHPGSPGKGTVKRMCVSFVAFISGCELRIVCTKSGKKVVYRVRVSRGFRIWIRVKATVRCRGGKSIIRR